VVDSGIDDNKGDKMKKFRVTVNGQTYDVDVEELGESSDKKDLAIQQPETLLEKSISYEADWINIDAPMQGKIVLVKVVEGEMVQKGDVVAILEAMKMENEIVAPESGEVVSVNVTAGQAIETGDIIVSLA